MQREATTQLCFNVCIPTPLSEPKPEPDPEPVNSRVETRKNFATKTSTSLFPNTDFNNPDSLPSLQDAFAQFIRTYPQYTQTYPIDEIRTREYYNLTLSNQVCLDYIGIGLYSFSQLHNQISRSYPFHKNPTQMSRPYPFDKNPVQISQSDPFSKNSTQVPTQMPQSNPFNKNPTQMSRPYKNPTQMSQSDPFNKNPTQVPAHSSDFPVFHLSYRSVNLTNQLTEPVTEPNLETAIKNRIRDFLNISEDDYSLILTANRTSAFKLLAESYPFGSCKKLLTVYDHETEAIDTLISNSEKRGANSIAAEFTWPKLRIRASKLRGLITRSKKIGSCSRRGKGLFVFQLQSRVTGTRYSYQWMKVAQEHGWHVLLDACAVGPKDMDSLGLSFFKPDFLICSFYKVFGENPSGFGCLFVKKSVVSILEDCTAGIVSIVSAKQLFYMTADDDDEEFSSDVENDEIELENRESGSFSARWERGESSNCGIIKESSGDFSEESPYEIKQLKNVFEMNAMQMQQQKSENVVEKLSVRFKGMSVRQNVNKQSEIEDFRNVFERQPAGVEGVDVVHQQNAENLSETEESDNVFEKSDRIKRSEIEEFRNVFEEQPAGVEGTNVLQLNAEKRYKIEESDRKKPTEIEEFRIKQPAGVTGMNILQQTAENPSEIEDFRNFSDKNPSRIPRNRNSEVECRCLDQIDSVGLSLINNRTRYLVNWLIQALSKLRHPNIDTKVPLVKIYGPKIKFDRGPAIAFNVFDWKGEKVEPILIQKLADRKSISLSYSFLHHIWFPDKYLHEKGTVLEKRRFEPKESSSSGNRKRDLGVRVVTAAFGFIANFADAYRLWMFIAQFLDADFVEKERWRYTALNQNTVDC